MSRRHLGSQALHVYPRGQSVERTMLVAWIAFLFVIALMVTLATLATLSATSHAQAPKPGPHSMNATHARFVVDAPGLPRAHLAAIARPLLLVHGASPTMSLRVALLEPASATHASSTKTNALRLTIGAAREPDRVGIGGTWNLGGHRALVLDLTPSPRHCAPLVQVSF